MSRSFCMFIPRVIPGLRQLAAPISYSVGCQQRVYIAHLSLSSSVSHKPYKELFSISRAGSKLVLSYFSSQKTSRLQVKMASRIRQNFHADSEALINKQINMEFYASYVYLSMVRNKLRLLYNIFLFISV